MKSAREIFKPISFNLNYEVSNLGRVRSVERYAKHKNGYRKVETRILKPTISNKGYYMVALSKNSKMHTYTIHKLVIDTFIGNDKDLIINHIDGNKLNNNLSNLEYVTQKENIVKAWEQNKCENIRKQAKVNIVKATSKLKKQVDQFDIDNNFIKRWNCIKDAHRELKIDDANISACCKGRKRIAGGYIWRYANEEC